MEVALTGEVVAETDVVAVFAAGLDLATLALGAATAAVPLVSFLAFTTALLAAGFGTVDAAAEGDVALDAGVEVEAPVAAAAEPVDERTAPALLARKPATVLFLKVEGLAAVAAAAVVVAVPLAGVAAAVFGRVVPADLGATPVDGLDDGAVVPAAGAVKPRAV